MNGKKKTINRGVNNSASNIDELMNLRAINCSFSGAMSDRLSGHKKNSTRIYGCGSPGV
jgi:hypothetical protein